MMCAIYCTDNCHATYYSNMLEYAHDASPELQILLADFDNFLDEGQVMAITVGEDGGVILMEFVGLDDWNEYGEPVPPKALCYNVMKAYCNTWGVQIAEPEYLGEYFLEVAREAYKHYGDYMVIMPVMEDDEVFCAS